MASKIFVFISFLLLVNPAFSVDKVSTGSTAWATASTWSPSGEPAAGDNVTILSGHSVTMNGKDGACLSLTILGTANWTQARVTAVGTGGLVMNGGTITGTASGTLNVAGDFTTIGTNSIGRCILNISGTTTVSTVLNITSTTGTKTFGNLIITGTFNNSVNEDITINGNLQNDGAFNVCMSCGPTNAIVTFTGATSNTVTGVSTTAFNLITLDKGTSAANVMDFQSPITMLSGGLALTNGTFKLSGTSTITPFTADITGNPYLIPATTALWCNGGTINSGSMNWTVAGEMRISSGTVNVGTSIDNSFRAENSGTTKLTVEGGALNVAGRIARVGAGDFITMNVSGGTITVATAGSTSATMAPFHSDQASSVFNWSSGTIVVERAGTGNLGFAVTAGTSNFTGGILQVGNSSTPASQIMIVNANASLANLHVSSSNATARLALATTILQAVIVNSGTLDANNFGLTVGGSWTDNGTFTPGTGTVTFNGTGTQTMTKPGGETYYNLTVFKTGGVVSLANDVTVSNALTMTLGNVDIASSTLTLGTSVVSIGSLSYTSGTLIGCFRRWLNATGTAYLFPIGTSSWYRPSQITFTALSAGTLTTCFISSNPGNNGLPVFESGKTIPNQFTEGYWNLIAANGLSSTNYTLSLTGNGFTSYSVGSSTRVLFRALVSDPWSLSGTHVAASGNTANRSGITGGLSAQFCFGKPTCSSYAAAAVNGNVSPCVNSIERYQVDASNPVHTYSWAITPPAAGSVTGGQGTPTATITWGASGQQARVDMTEFNDCSEGNAPISLSVAVSPIATSTITGSVTVSTNETGLVYSVVGTSGYTYTWSLPLGGGTIAGGQGTNSVTINWGATAGIYTVRVTTTRLCGAPDIQNLSVTVRGPLYSRVSGSWATAGSWSNVPCGGTQTASPTAPTASDEVIICSAHTITMNGNPGACRKLTIDGIATWTQARTTNVGTGGIIINSTGNITGVDAGILTSAGGLTGNSNGNISSTTVIIRLQTNPQNITSDGALNLLDVTTTATNTGTVTVTNALFGAGAFTQSASSLLNMTGATLSVSTLNASAAGNLVNYGANVGQAIRAVTYHNLKVSGTATKTLVGATILNGDLDISAATSILDVSTSNYGLTVAGNWNNSGSFNERFGTVTFNGSAAQSIAATSGETFNNLNMSGSGSKNMNTPVTINFDFTLSSTLNTNNNNISIRGNFDNSGTYNGGTNDVTFINNTSILGSSVTTFNNVIISATLTGHSSNMNVTGNWTNNGTFVHNGGTVVFNGAAQTLGGSSPNTFNHVSIAGSGTKTLAGALTTNGNLTISSALDVSTLNYGLDVKGNWTNNGVFTSRSGTVTFSGTVAQSIGGSIVANFYDITQNNTAGVSLGQSQNLLNTLTISAGTFAASGNNFTLKSTASNTARIATIPAGSDYSGNIIMERYTGTGPTDWRFFSSAVSGATIADWADDFATSGFTGSTDPANPFVSIYSYDESVAGDKNNGFVPATNITNPIGGGAGFWVYLGPNPATYEVTGPPHKFSQTPPVSFTSSGGPDHDGWNLVSNPYPCEIDWDNASWTKTNMNNAVYIYNSANASFASYVGGIGVNGGSRYIASQQAFWVQSNLASPGLGMVEQIKAATNPSYLKQAQVNANGPISNTIRLSVAGNGLKDETLIHFESGALAGFDKHLDALKLISSLNISSLTPSGEDLSISQVPELSAPVSIPVRITVYTSGVYTISRDSSWMLPLSACAVLEDKLTGSFTDLHSTSSYSFSIVDTTYSPRFVLHFYPPISKQTKSISCYGASDGKAIASGTGAGPWNYTWRDSLGAVIKTTPNSFAADSLVNLSAGIYSVDVSGCWWGIAKEIFEVLSPAPLTLAASFTDESCNGSGDGAASVLASGGTIPYVYLWNNNSTQPGLQNLNPDTYSVVVTDANGCSAKYSAVISSPVVADFGTDKDTAYIFQTASVTFNNASSGALYYSWDFGDASAPETSVSPVHLYIFSGTYTIMLTANNGVCFDTVYKTVVVLDTLSSTGLVNSSAGTSISIFYEDEEPYFLIDLPEHKDVVIDITNTIGETVLTIRQKVVGKTKIKPGLSAMASGIYLAIIRTRDMVYAGKLINSKTNTH